MAKSLTSSIVLLFTLNFSFAQPFLKIEADQLQLDPLGRLILLDKDQGNIWCYSNDLELIAYNQINVWGNAFQLDLNDPMKPLLFFPDVNRINFFDEQLSASTEIDLDYFQFYNIQAVGNASLGGFWLYSRDLNKIIRIDQSGRTLFQSSDLNFVFGAYPIVEQIREVDDVLVLITEEGMLYTFDFFGNFQFKLQLEENGQYYLSSDKIFFLKASGALSLIDHEQEGLMHSLYQFDQSFHSFSVFGKDFYGLTAEGVFKIPLVK
jgi:hypothetical protein